MPDTKELRKMLSNSELNSSLSRIYTENEFDYQIKRYIDLSYTFDSLFGEGRQIGVFSAPGRTEVGGNHTDHNHGKVLAAGINLDAIAIASPVDNTTVRIKSEGYNMDTVDYSDLSIHDNETGHSASIVRGVCAAFIKRGYKIGGFDAVTTSKVISGSGLSSSAAFEVLICTIINHLFNGGEISPVEIAKISQWAENVYFGKPCGLMDQTACSVGGFVKIDFENPEKPVIEKIDFDFSSCGHSLCIVDSGASHSDLTDEYAAVRKEMESVAAVFGKSVLREVDKKIFCENISKVRSEVNDRAVLRALHFYGENEKVEQLADYLKCGDFGSFKSTIISSGYSSFMYNQNVFSCKKPQEQALSVALAVCEELLKNKGAFRVHGGGFAGTIQAFVPNEMLEVFKNAMEQIFGKNSVYILQIRPEGGYCVTK